jgi:hypothetical protein
MHLCINNNNNNNYNNYNNNTTNSQHLRGGTEIPKDSHGNKGEKPERKVYAELGWERGGGCPGYSVQEIVQLNWRSG